MFVAVTTVAVVVFVVVVVVAAAVAAVAVRYAPWRASGNLFIGATILPLDVARCYGGHD